METPGTDAPRKLRVYALMRSVLSVLFSVEGTCEETEYNNEPGSSTGESKIVVRAPAYNDDRAIITVLLRIPKIFLSFHPWTQVRANEVMLTRGKAVPYIAGGRDFLTQRTLADWHNGREWRANCLFKSKQISKEAKVSDGRESFDPEAA
jgi:hypothetical protein